MKILKRGTPPKKRKYVLTCKVCHSKIEFEEHEGKYSSDQRDGDVIRFKCPVCGSDLFGYPKKG